MFILLINFLLYFTTLTKSYLRFRCVNIYVLLWIFFTLSAFASIYIWETGIYRYYLEEHIKNNLSLFPFLVLYIGFLVLTYPIKKFSQTKIKGFIFPSPKCDNLYFKISLLIAFILSFLLVIYFPNTSISDIDYRELYLDRNSGEGSIFPSYVEILYSLYLGIYPYFLISILRRLMENDYLKSFILLFFAIFPVIVINIISRGALLFHVFQLVFLYLIFRNSFNSKIKKYFNIIGCLLFYTVLSLFMLISYSRFGEGSESFNSILRYAGEPFLNFNLVFWNNVNHSLNGIWHFSPFLSLFEEERHFFDIFSRIDYYSSLSGVPMRLFKTFFGDLYVDIGWGLTIVFTIILVIFVEKKTRHTVYIHAYKLLILYYYYQICVASIFNFTFGDTRSIIYITILSISYFYLKYNVSFNNHSK